MKGENIMELLFDGEEVFWTSEQIAQTYFREDGRFQLFKEIVEKHGLWCRPFPSKGQYSIQIHNDDGDYLFSFDCFFSTIEELRKNGFENAA